MNDIFKKTIKRDPMGLWRLLKSRKIYIAVMFILSTLSFVLFNLSKPTFATISWPLQMNGIAAGVLAAHSTDNVSLLNCNLSTGNQYEHYDNTQTSIPLDGYSVSKVMCADSNMASAITAPDGSLFARFTDGNPAVNYIARVKNNSVQWKTNIMTDAQCSSMTTSQEMMPYYTSIGEDGNIYTLLMPPLVSYGCHMFFAGYNSATGAQLFKIDLSSHINGSASSGTVWGQGRLWTLNDRIIIVDNAGMYREFAYGTGTENTSHQYQFPDNITYTNAYRYLANSEGRVFVVYEAPWGACEGSERPDGVYIRYHDIDGDTGSVKLNGMDCNGTFGSGSYKFQPAYDGNIAAFIGGKINVFNMNGGSDRVITPSAPSGYTQQIMSYWEDTTGNNVLVRQLTATSNGQGEVSVDAVNWTTSTLSHIASMSPSTYPDTRMLINIPTFNVGDIADGYLYLPACQASLSICNSSDIWEYWYINKVALSGFSTVIKNTSMLVTTFSDGDGDGLTAWQELQQGTSDGVIDTDGDGLDDQKESIWNTNRDAEFCDTSTPKNCAYPDPTTKDVYVEIDWMNDTGNSRVLKPTNTQLSIVEDMFSGHGINIHFDTGQFGGGNALSSYIHTLPLASQPLATDFGDIKSSNFNTDRDGIWKYLVYGYEYADVSGSSGMAEVSGDDIFVSGGLVEDNPNTVSEDRAVSGTIAHEIGHTLCLSSTQMYEEQPSECVYNSIDNSSIKPVNYESVMNYRYQLTDDDDMGVVNYSDGTHGTGDHDDWGAVILGMADFTGIQTALGVKAKNASTEKKTMDPALIVSESPMEHLQTKQEEPSVFSPMSTQDKNKMADNMQKITNNNSPSKTRVSQDVESDFQQLPVLVGLASIIGLGGVAIWRMKHNR